MTTIGDRKLALLEVRDEGMVVIPFGFTINGTSDPDGLIGDELVSVARVEAGEFTLTFNSTAYQCFGGALWASKVDDSDLIGGLNWDNFTSAGTCVGRFTVGTVETDPADNALCGGYVLVKKTDHKAGR